MSTFLLKTSCIATAGALLALLTGCGGGEVTVTVEPTYTGTPKADILAYKKEINELGQRADQINREYRALIDKHDAGQVSDQDMASKARQNGQAYEEIGFAATDMKVPKELQAAHKKFIAGFFDWQSAFKNYEAGYREKDNAALDRAGDLDDQAVIEINQAVNLTNQVES